MRIEITPNRNGYKSIKSFVWNDIPNFSIITGRNGSGKTQLLEIISYHLTGTKPQSGQIGVSVNVEGVSIAPDEVGFVPSGGRFSGGGGASVALMQSLRQNLYQLQQNLQSYVHDPNQMTKARRIQKILAGRNWVDETKHGLVSLDEDEFLALLVDVDVAASLATIFVAHRLKILETLEKGTPGVGKDGKPLGPAPWDVVNEALKVGGFPYQVVSPQEVRIMDHYELKLRDLNSNIEIKPDDLSSREKVILQLILWLFSSSNDGVFPKLLLLDEPDAHLHPAMTVQFLDVIAEVLVKKHNVRVMMTTHSPSTVALAPQGSVFQMERNHPEMILVRDRESLISVLTAGLVTVSKSTKFCFVEDEDDVIFYSTLYEILTDVGPSRDMCSIKVSPSLVFIAASVGRGVSKISGGKGIVEKWIEKLDAPPLTSTFIGLVDRDVGNRPGPRINVIGRYSYENYILDPLNVYGLLVEDAKHPKIDNFNISSGDEHVLRSLNSEILQKISDIIVDGVERCDATLTRGQRVEVNYTNGVKLMVPSWVIERRGHDLLPIFQQAWGGHQLINPQRLIKALRRVRLIPRELATLFSHLQQ